MDTHHTDTFGSASSSSPSARDSTDDTKARARESASRLKDEAREQAQALKRDAEMRGREFVDERKARAAEEINDVAGALRMSADHLRDQQRDQVGRYVSWAADELESFASTLRQRDLGDWLRQTEQFARRQPAAFVGGAVAAGFLLSRFLKASSKHDGTRDDVEPLTDTAATGREAPAVSVAGTESPYVDPAAPAGHTKPGL